MIEFGTKIENNNSIQYIPKKFERLYLISKLRTV